MSDTEKLNKWGFEPYSRWSLPPSWTIRHYEKHNNVSTL